MRSFISRTIGALAAAHATAPTAALSLRRGDELVRPDTPAPWQQQQRGSSSGSFPVGQTRAGSNSSGGATSRGLTRVPKGADLPAFPGWVRGPGGKVDPRCVEKLAHMDTPRAGGRPDTRRRSALGPLDVNAEFLRRNNASIEERFHRKVAAIANGSDRRGSSGSDEDAENNGVSPTRPTGRDRSQTRAVARTAKTAWAPNPSVTLVPSAEKPSVVLQRQKKQSIDRENFDASKKELSPEVYRANVARSNAPILAARDSNSKMHMDRQSAHAGFEAARRSLTVTKQQRKDGVHFLQRADFNPDCNNMQWRDNVVIDADTGKASPASDGPWSGRPGKMMAAALQTNADGEFKHHDAEAVSVRNFHETSATALAPFLKGVNRQSPSSFREINEMEARIACNHHAAQRAEHQAAQQLPRRRSHAEWNVGRSSASKREDRPENFKRNVHVASENAVDVDEESQSEVVFQQTVVDVDNVPAAPASFTLITPTNGAATAAKRPALSPNACNVVAGLVELGKRPAERGPEGGCPSPRKFPQRQYGNFFPSGKENTQQLQM